jgi:hypothetical protein
MGGCIDLVIFLVVENRNSIAGKDHGHRQGDGNPEAAFTFLVFGFGVHCGLPFVMIAGACRLENSFAGSVPISNFPAN